MSAIPEHHKEALVRYFQEGDEELAVDGDYGPKTAEALERYIAEWATLDVPATVDDRSSMLKAWKLAKSYVGEREDPIGSNGSKFIEWLRRITGLSRRGGGEWCAVFISAMLHLVGIDAKSRGAPGVVRALAKLPRGRWVDIDSIEPGFIGICYRERGRNKFGKMTHHVQFLRAFASDDGMRIEHIGGNEGHRVKSKIWRPEKFFEGVIRVATID